MKTNTVKVIANLIYVGNIEEVTLKGNNKMSTLYARLAFPRPLQTKVGDTYETKQDIFDAQFVGNNAEYVFKYGNNTHTEGERKGKFIARQVVVEGFYETYMGKVSNPEPMELNTEAGTIEIPEGYISYTVPKTRFKVMSFDFLDYVEQDKTVPTAPAKKEGLKLKVKTTTDKKTVKTKTGNAEDLDLNDTDLPDPDFDDAPVQEVFKEVEEGKVIDEPVKATTKVEKKKQLNSETDEDLEDEFADFEIGNLS